MRADIMDLTIAGTCMSARRDRFGSHYGICVPNQSQTVLSPRFKVVRHLTLGTMFIYRFKVLVRPAVFKRNLSNPSASFSIPVVNFAKFQTASSLTEKKKTAVEIVSAFKECGFVYLSNHGISPCESLTYTGNVA